MRAKSAILVLGLATAAPLACGQLTETLKLTASDAAGGDQFGGAVAISGTTAIVGARLDGDAGLASGSAYIFDTTTGEQLFKVTASDAAEIDLFGWSVAIRGSTAIVGASGDDDAGTDSGAAYVFDTTTGQQLFKLVAADGAEFDEFGSSVAISGTTAIIGAPLDGEDDDISGEDSGSAYVFDVTTGQQLFKLVANDAERIEQFGNSVAISGTTAIVGSFLDDDFGGQSGSAYLFDVVTGEQQMQLNPTDAAPFDQFGVSVAISGTTALVGARSDEQGPATGSAYVFDTATGQQLFKLTASDAAQFDFFGNSVAITGSTALVAADQNDDDGSASGSAYVFDLAAPPPCPGDIADDFGTIGADGMVSFGDFLALLGLVGPCPGGTPGCTGDIADDFGTLNGGDGMVSFGDFLALLGLIGPCP